MNIAGPDILDHVDQALAHPRTDNKSLHQLLRWSADDIGDAAVVLRLLSLRAGAILTDLEDIGMADDVLHDVLYQEDGTLRNMFHPDLLASVLACADAAAAGELWWGDGEVPTSVLDYGTALVRTAYLFVREMNHQANHALGHQ